MSKKNQSVLDLLISRPWWVSVVVSGASFVFLKFILPSINFQNPLLNGMFKGVSGIALFVAPFYWFLLRFHSSRRGRKGDFSIPNRALIPSGRWTGDPPWVDQLLRQ